MTEQGYNGYLQQQKNVSGQPDLQKLLQEGKPIYVLNRTGKLPGRGPSDHILVIKDGNNNSHEVMIPAHRFPFLLSGALPPSLLKDSPALYNAFNKGILQLISPEQAQEMLSDPMAQQVADEAQRRLQPRNAVEARRMEAERREQAGMSQLSDHRPPGANPGISQVDSDLVNEHVDAVPPPLRLADSRGAQSVEEQAPENVNKKIVQLMLDLTRTPELWNDILTHLSGIDEDEFSTDDLGYIIEKAAAQRKIVQWAQTMLEARSGSAPKQSKRSRRRNK